MLDYFGDAESEPPSPLPETMTAQQAIDKLTKAGIIDTPEYWEKAVSCVKYLDGLLVKMAGRLE